MKSDYLCMNDQSPSKPYPLIIWLRTYMSDTYLGKLPNWQLLIDKLPCLVAFFQPQHNFRNIRVVKTARKKCTPRQWDTR